METSPKPRTRPAVVLVASDQEWTARSIDSILGPSGYAVLRAYSGKQALDLAQTTAPDALILDARTRDIDGFEVCRLLRDGALVCALTPVILTSEGANARADRLKALSSGAWEFYLQPLDGEALLLQLRTFLSAKREGDRTRAENLLDELTGLYSMRGLTRRAREIGAEAFRLRAPLACISIAPQVADSLGAPVDDIAGMRLVVEHLGSLLRSGGRVSDAIGRFGQAEIALVAPATDSAGAVKLVERLRELVNQHPLRREGADSKVAIKAGYHAVSNFAESPIDALEMLVRASTALRSTLSDAAAPANEIRAFEQLPTSLVS